MAAQRQAADRTRPGVTISATKPASPHRAALDYARGLLNTDPRAAEAQAEAILGIAPDNREARLLLGAAHRRQGNLIESLALLKPLVRLHPDYAAAHEEWGLTQAAMGLHPAAIASLRQAVSLDPQNPVSWRALGASLRATSEPAQADAAFLQQVRHAASDPVLQHAISAANAADVAQAERLLRARLSETPDDVAALRMLGDLRAHEGDAAEAEHLLSRCLELAPSLVPARLGLAALQLHQGRADDARPHINRLLAAAPRDPRYLSLQAALLAMTGERDRAIDIYEAILRECPDEPGMWLSLGHALRATGRYSRAVDAYRNACRTEPSLGEAYWSLANLKTAAFGAADVEAMQTQLARPDSTDEDRIHLHYALGSAFEQARNYAVSFGQYEAGARLKRQQISYSAARTTAQFSQIRARINAAFLAGRPNAGHPDTAPIFVVGLPRAGSTLIEQILASHSQVEGTSELHDIGDLASSLGWIRNADATTYLDSLTHAEDAALTALGACYIARTRARRKTSRPFFVDKMPDNFVHAGLIALILPCAKIIDIRRRPMAAGFAVFKQFFPRGQDFTYDLAEIGAYYRDYAALMDHWDEVLPRRVHRISYEALVSDPEPEIRRLLAYCGLPFEAACLTPHETRRDVTTASSEQVRQPISREAVDHWRSYQPWLGPLRDALEAPY